MPGALITISLFMPYNTACLFASSLPETLRAIRSALPKNESDRPGPFDVRIFSGVMGHFYTDMGSPGLIGCTKAAWPTHDGVDASWKSWSDVERCFDELVAVARDVTGQLPGVRILVLWVGCHGGWDDCQVVVYEQGRSIFQGAAALDPDAYANAIGDGVALLGVRLKDGYFPPLEKGAFNSVGRVAP